MSTSTAPEYALSFSTDAVHLMERSDASAMTAARWRERASAPFDAPDFRSEMARLRKLVANGPDARVVLIIPDDQILYTSLPMGGRDDVAAGLGQALDGLTPYPVADLAWDWRPQDGQDVRVAAVARQTLREAEDFARRHGFDTDGFLADPAEGLFPEAPRFVDSDVAVVRPVVTDAVVAADVKDEPAPDADAAKPDGTAELTPAAPDDAEEDALKTPVEVSDSDDGVVAKAQTDAGPDLASEAEVAEKTTPAETAAAPVNGVDGASVEATAPEAADTDDGLAVSKADADHPASTASSEADAPKTGLSEAAALPAAGVAVASAPVAASAVAPAKPGTGVTDFLPKDLPSAVPMATPDPQASPDAPRSELTDAADLPSQSRAPQPLPDRAKAVLDRAAVARSRRDSEPAPAPERHPGARGGVGGLLLMLGALLLGLMLIWSFATPEPRLSEPAITATAPDARTATPAATIPDSQVQPVASPEAATPAQRDGETAVTSGVVAVPAAAPSAQIAPTPAPAESAPVVVTPSATLPAMTGTQPAPATAAAPASETTTAGEAATSLAPVAAAPSVVAPVPAEAPAATTATSPAPATTTAPAVIAPQHSPAAAPSHATTPKVAPAKPAATVARPSSVSRPSTAPRRSQPAAAPTASDADQLPAVVPGRRALTRSERPTERPHRSSTRATEAASTPARATAAPASSTAPVRASRPASAPRPERATTTSTPSVRGSTAPAPRPRPRPEEGSADESVTAADMTADERAVADGWLADLYRQNPTLPRLSAATQPKGLVRLAEARPTRRPVADQKAVDAAVEEAVGKAVPRKKKTPASTDGDRPAARAKTAAPKTESSKAASSKAVPEKTQTARTDNADRPATRPSRKSSAPASPAAVESAIAEAVGKSSARPGKVAASAPAELTPLKKPARKATVPDAQAEAVAAAVAAPPAAAPAAAPETRTASRSPAPVAVPVTPPADDPAVAAQRMRDEQLQAQAEARARAGADAAARAEMQARAAAEARARAQEAAEERAAIASRGEYRPPELDDEPEVAVTAAKGTGKGQVASAATVGGMDIGKTQVIGVIGAGRASRGLIRLRNGKIVTVRLGDRIDGGAINSIGNGRISYVKGGRQFNLPILNGR